MSNEPLAGAAFIELRVILLVNVTILGTLLATENYVPKHLNLCNQRSGLLLLLVPKFKNKSPGAPGWRGR